MQIDPGLHRVNEHLDQPLGIYRKKMILLLNQQIKGVQ
jgi:hypothetical protein